MNKCFWIGALALCLAACGGGGGSSNNASASNSASSPSSIPPSTGQISQPSITVASTTANTVPVTVDSTFGFIDTAYVTVTICAPGTTNCATIDHVLLDSGSAGLRLLKSALPVGFPQAAVNDPASGNPLAECAVFGSGYTWGPLTKVDLQMAGETAHSLNMQVIDDSYATIPNTTSCAHSGSSMGASGTASLGANGIIGVDVYQQDCGAGCAASVQSDDPYYACAGTTCTQTAVALGSQLSNPVSGFATDNNGVALTLPSISTAGVTTATGTLTFGINTQADNARGTTTVLATDGAGNLAALYKSTTEQSFIDSGSGALYLMDASLGLCTTAPYLSPQLYCPTGQPVTTNFSLTGMNIATLATSITVGNASTLLTSGNSVFNDFAVDAQVLNLSVLDLGLPYFFGKTVFFGISGADPTTASGSPYVAVKS